MLRSRQRGEPKSAAGVHAADQTAEALAGLYIQGRYQELETLAQSLIARDGANGKAWKALGVALLNQGRIGDAVIPVNEAASLLPDDAEAQANLGNLLQSQGLGAQAEASYRRALELDAEFAEASCNLGNVLNEQGRMPEAEAAYRRALELKPELADAHYNLGNALYKQTRYVEAETRFRRAIGIAPDFAGAHRNLGLALRALERLNEAEASYRFALSLDGTRADTHDGLGSILKEQGRFSEAEASLRQAIALEATRAEAHHNLGSVLAEQGRQREAESCYRLALQLKPDYAAAYNHLGVTLKSQSRLVESVACFRRAVELDPNYAQAYQNLALSLAYLADFGEVVALSDTALRLRPDSDMIWEQRLYCFSYHPDLSAADIFKEFVRWGNRFPDPVVDFSSRDRTPGRKLRVGYLSPDFRRHTSRLFFWPLFVNRDRASFDLYAYSNNRIDDAFTAEFKSVFDYWRNIRGVKDGEAARMVREDEIDILVDCCSHMQDERLRVFALKPAPVQATWLGAAWTTGLKTVDYALQDGFVSPEGTLTAEKIVRLPHFFASYRAPDVTTPIAIAPCLNNGHVTFGYSGRSERLNHRTFKAWGEILRRMPAARLILDFKSFADPATQSYFRQFALQHGMDESRVIMRHSANIYEGLGDIDIVLDSFPHSGGTMIFDALWMGVPVLTLAGRPPVGRIGTGLMMNLGLPQWVADSEDEYIDRACVLGGDHAALAELRSGMRRRVQESPLMDGPGFARDYETALRGMFTTWCANQA